MRNDFLANHPGWHLLLLKLIAPFTALQKRLFDVFLFKYRIIPLLHQNIITSSPVYAAGRARPNGFGRAGIISLSHYHIITFPPAPLLIH
jgi:hypothetical protein